jgi:hypothetical protein
MLISSEMLADRIGELIRYALDSGFRMPLHIVAIGANSPITAASYYPRPGNVDDVDDVVMRRLVGEGHRAPERVQ